MTVRRIPYRVFDVFTDTPLQGNPLGVFLDAEGLSSDDMQSLARELNLSETTFVLPPGAAHGDALAHVRIFTPGRELPFAGHPTIGTAAALVAAGRVPDGVDAFVLAEGVGPVPIRLEQREPFLAWLRTPPIRFGATPDRAACARALGLEPADLFGDLPAQVLSAGNPFLYVPLASPDTVDRAVVDMRAADGLSGDGGAGIFFFAPVPGGVYARMVGAESTGVGEDPATGSATGPLGAYLARYGLLEARDGATFTNEQGVKMRRRSIVRGIIRYRGGELDSVEVGGNAVPVIEGAVTLG